MSTTKRTVLITGCSDGGMGAELAKEFHKAGLHVYATARDVNKMKELTSMGIETLSLDVSSDESIKACAEKVKTLDILINNAGASYNMPVVDLDISEARKLFDLNVWAVIAVTQAFIPQLRSSSKPIIANNTSIAALMTIPFQATYNASKAAISSYTKGLRLELQPFKFTVIELRTGGVVTNFIKNQQAKVPALPEKSIYAPAKKEVDFMMSGDWVKMEEMKTTANLWAKGVVSDLLKKNPPNLVVRGDQAGMANWLATFLPESLLNFVMKRMTGFTKVEKILQATG